MKTWAKAILMTAVALAVIVGTALAVTWEGSNGVDQMLLYQGNDVINMGADNDTFNMGDGTDTTRSTWVRATTRSRCGKGTTSSTSSTAPPP